jgi:hypothetical protein
MADTEEEYFCSQCNSKVSAVDKFCKNCGAELEEIVSETINYPKSANVSNISSKNSIIGVIAIFVGILIFIFFLNKDGGNSQKTVTYQNSYPNEASEVEFCERVDDDLNCINPNTTFNHGIVYAKATSNTPLNDNYVYVTIFIIKGKSESLFDKGSYEVNPDNNVMAIKINFYQSGMYRVIFRKITNEKIAEGVVTIK